MFLLVALCSLSAASHANAVLARHSLYQCLLLRESSQLIPEVNPGKMPLKIYRGLCREKPSLLHAQAAQGWEAMLRGEAMLRWEAMLATACVGNSVCWPQPLASTLSMVSDASTSRRLSCQSKSLQRRLCRLGTGFRARQRDVPQGALVQTGYARGLRRPRRLSWAMLRWGGHAPLGETIKTGVSEYT